ncbi:MAG: sugar transferase [Candidatus Eisenbacteria bacterium]|uniref:Sugar transferase n=1 Tax=Eiseniibacteriota bacterium TaxID=2212470 RepID=A0A538U0H1_UNCEI|nr:MAG: sugar transferase [Candidatus Eisenbacteria bacterium]
MPPEQPRPARELPIVRAGLPRVIEIPLAALGLLIASPFLLLAALAIAMTSPGGALFRQVRVGRGGRLFGLYKLRSMRLDADGPALTARIDARVTSVGRWLRRTKLDELPQLWNVLRGEMALLGPRPEVPRYANLDDPRWRRILDVRPGITDPLTLRLRDEDALMPVAAEDRERFYLETLQPIKLEGYLAYLATRSAWSDLAILIATALAIVRSRPMPSREELARRGRV